MLITSWIVNIVFYPEGPGVLFTVIAIPFSAIATYAAATDMDMSLFSRTGTNKVTIRSQYLGETSAALTWSIVTVGLVALDIIIWILVIQSVGVDLLEIFALLLCILGGIFALVGGIVAKREWDM